MTIFFGDVVGFGDLTAHCTPNELIDFMNLFCASLDTRIAKFNVYNVHTMGEEIMVVSGMPNKIGNSNSITIWQAISTAHHLESTSRRLNVLFRNENQRFV